MERGELDRTGRAGELEARRQEANEQLADLEKETKGLDKALQTARELDEFACSLAGLLDAKRPKLKKASDALAQMERGYAERRGLRRRRRVMAALRSAGAVPSHAAAEDTEDMDEADEAVAKRVQQRRSAKNGSSRRDGWDTSSASEDGLEDLRSDRAAFCAAAHKQLAADVDDRFSTGAALVAPLRDAKRKLEKGKYTQAYVPQALPDALSMHVEYSLLWWDPLQLCTPAGTLGEQGDGCSWGPRRSVTSPQLETFEWFDELSAFTELQGDEDPDAELIPQLVRRSVFPEVARRLRECWDPSSARESARIAGLLDECLLFDGDEDAREASAASSFVGLLEVALARIDHCLTNLAPEVFVSADALAKWYASDARQRLLWRSCKIARCALLLDGRIPDDRMQALVLQAVFATRIAPHLRGPRLDAAEMDLVDRFVGLLPERWLTSGLPRALVPLRDALGPRAPRSPDAAVTATQAARILDRLRCFDEAQALRAATA